MKYATLALIFCVQTSVVLADELPDSKMTPGDTNPVLTSAKICAKGFTTKDYRKVSVATKRQVYALYGAVNHKGVCAGSEGCEVDHLISLELGGANTVQNLWPEPYAGTEWNAHVKDRLENKLHELVCSGHITLKSAQHAISTDWIAAYKTYVGK